MPTCLPHAERCYQSIRGISSNVRDELRGHHHPTTEWLPSVLPTQSRRDAREFEFARFRFDYLLQKTNPQQGWEQCMFPNDFNRIAEFHA